MENETIELGTPELVLAPDPRLTTPCEPVPVPLSQKTVNRLSGFVNGMRRLMARHKGIGLAANQAGANIELIIAGHLVMVNPKVIWESPSLSYEQEACLSEPGEVVWVHRPRAIRVEFYPLIADNKPIQMRLDGKIARIVLHEIDHLRGKLLSEHKK